MQAILSSLRAAFTPRSRSPLILAAIAKNEMAAVHEWTAWHRLQGFDRLAVVDNGSTDGTAEYLEALAQLGLCEVLHIGKCDRFQVVAYERLLGLPGSKDAVLCFVDLDEFVVSEAPGRTAGTLLRKAFARRKVGAVGMHWRLFGSNGHVAAGPGPVTQRFMTHASDTQRSINMHIKTAVRASACSKFFVHNALLAEGYQYLNGDLQEAQFVDHPHKKNTVRHATAFAAPIGGALRVHHYVIKSREEYEAKVARRSAESAIPLNWDAPGFFKAHDINDDRCELMLAHADDLQAAMARLDRQLREGSHFHLQVRGAVDAVSPRGVVGWLADAAADDPATLSVKVYVNGHWQGQCVAGLQRPDLVKAGVSRSGRAGFHFRFEAPLQPGDIVHVRACANPTALARDTHVIA